MNLIKKYLKAFAQEQNIEENNDPINIEEYIYNEKYMFRVKNNIISYIYVVPEYRCMGICWEIIKFITKKAGTYYIDIPKKSSNYKYLKEKFASYGFIDGKYEKKYTYFINISNDFDKSTLYELMDKHGFIRLTETPKYADLMILETVYEEYVRVDCQLRSHISKLTVLADKSNLYRSLPQYCPKTVFITPKTKMKDIKNLKYPVIIKGTDDWCNAGASNQVCLSDKEAIKYIFDKLGNNFVLQEYITNIDLFKGRKYHLRMYWIVKFYDDPDPWRLIRRYRIITAEKKYNKNDLTDKDIHDSHFHSTEGEYTDLDLPLKKSESYYNQTKEICSAMYEIVKDIREKTDAFYVFGLDILPLDTGKVIILECNSHTGLAQINKNKSPSKIYYTELYEFIVKSYFPN